MDLISIIAIIVIIVKIMNKAGEAANKVERYGQPENVWDQMTGQNQRRTSASNQNTQWQQATRENIEKARKRAEQKYHELESEVVGELHKKNTYQMPKQNVRTTPAREQVRMQQVHAGRMEAEHNHSERVSPAEHHHPEDIIPENVLGTIEDLMVKGYDGNLCFERDFLGEALDMINCFTISMDIPEPTVDDAA